MGLIKSVYNSEVSLGRGVTVLSQYAKLFDILFKKNEVDDYYKAKRRVKPTTTTLVKRKRSSNKKLFSFSSIITKLKF